MKQKKSKRNSTSPEKGSARAATPRRKKGGGGKSFWNKSYKKGKGANLKRIRQGGPGIVNVPGEHLLLSKKPSEDLLKFCRFLARRTGDEILNPHSSVLDLGCGNGRHLIYLAKEYGVSGIGIDISGEALSDAKNLSSELNIEYLRQSLEKPLPALDASQSIILDMMTSHVLREAERIQLHSEIHRTLVPGGFLLFKTFLREGDLHAARMLRKNPGSEKGSYIHPKIGVEEHVFTIKEIESLFDENFIIHKKIKSYRHIRRGRAFKRRSICIYAQKK